jgi:hypothetical protein
MFERNIKSIMLFLISLKFVKKNKIMPYMALNLLGCMFHVSSFFYLPLYFVLNKKINSKVILFLFIIGQVFYLFQVQWYRTILLRIGTIFPLRLQGMIQVYLMNRETSSFYGFTFGYIERTFSFIVLLHYSDILYRKNDDNLPVLNSFFLYSFIFLFFTEITIITERVPALFIFSYWILYPQIYVLIPKNKKVLFLILFLFYGLIKIVLDFNILIAQYDNVLFDHKTYQERLFELNYYHRMKIR